MTLRTLWTLVGVLIFIAPLQSAQAKVLFEGYYKITLSGEQVGYYIQRYELDSKAKQFISTYYFKTNQKAGNIAESLKAISSPTLKPISYQFTSLQGQSSKTIDAKFKDNKMDVKMVENGKPRTFQKILPPGTFLSTFLTYMLLQGEKGIQKGVKYDYNAIAEEDGKALKGTVYVAGEEKHMGISSFKILNTFKNSQFVNYVTNTGESLSSYSPVQKLGAELVVQPSDALQGFATQDSSWKMVFGDIPLGKENLLAKKGAASSPAAPAKPAPVEIKNTTDKKEK